MSSDAVIVVDRKGLARKLAHKPKAWVLYELLQNAWDEDVTQVQVTTEMVPNKPLCRIVVEDDSPEGFQDLASVFTMFRDSKKRNDPTKRGRFELGEKLILALATRFYLITTKGCVTIEGDTRTVGRKKLERGTRVEVELRMTREEHAEMLAGVFNVIPVPGKPTWINGEAIPHRQLVATVKATLPTIVADEEGALKRTPRLTTINVFEPRPGEPPRIYEMGLPIKVLGDGDKYDYDIQQRVPVNWERDSIPDSVLAKIRVAVVNDLSSRLTKEEVGQAWVGQALESPDIEGGAVDDILTAKHGKKVVVYDPTNTEAVRNAQVDGAEVLHGGHYNSAQWENIRNRGTVARPAGQTEYRPRDVYSNDPDARPQRVIPRDKWNTVMTRHAKFAEALCKKLEIAASLEVVFANEPQAWWTANYGRAPLATLTFNVAKLGKAWFKRSCDDPEVLELLVHEFGHQYGSDHFSKDYHRGLCKIAARLAKLDPKFFKTFASKDTGE